MGCCAFCRIAKASLEPPRAGAQDGVLPTFRIPPRWKGRPPMKRALSFLAPLLLLSTTALAGDAPKAETATPAKIEAKSTTTATDTIPAAADTAAKKPVDKPVMIGGPM